MTPLPGFGLVVNNEPFDPRMQIGTAIRISCDRELIEAKGQPWFTASVLPYLPQFQRVIITVKQAPDRDRGDFPAWMESVIAPLSGKGIVWQLWNEMNDASFWPKPDAVAYVALAAAVRKVMPRGEILIAGGLSTLDKPFLTDLLGAGIKRYVSGLGLHPYQFPGSSGAGVGTDVAWMRRVSSMPVYVTEVGFQMAGGSGGRYDGDFMLDAYRSATHAGAVCVIWYRWPCGDVTDHDNADGLIGPDGTPRAALLSLLAEQRTLARWGIIKTSPDPISPTQADLGGTGNAK